MIQPLQLFRLSLIHLSYLSINDNKQVYTHLSGAVAPISTNVCDISFHIQR